MKYSFKLRVRQCRCFVREELVTISAELISVHTCHLRSKHKLHAAAITHQGRDIYGSYLHEKADFFSLRVAGHYCNFYFLKMLAVIGRGMNEVAFKSGMLFSVSFSISVFFSIVSWLILVQ